MAGGLRLWVRATAISHTRISDLGAMAWKVLDGPGKPRWVPSSDVKRRAAAEVRAQVFVCKPFWNNKHTS